MVEDVFCGFKAHCAHSLAESVHRKEVYFGDVAHVNPVEEVSGVPDLPFCVAASDDFCKAFEVLPVLQSAVLVSSKQWHSLERYAYPTIPAGRIATMRKPSFPFAYEVAAVMCSLLGNIW